MCDPEDELRPVARELKPCLGALSVPASLTAPAGSACAYRKAVQRASGFAVVGIAVQLAVADGTCKSAGVGAKCDHHK